MLRVTIELVPFGDEQRKKTIGTVELWNTGGPEDDAHYEFDVKSEDGSCHGNVFHHRRADGAFALLARAFRIAADRFER